MSAFRSDVLARVVSDLEAIADDGDGLVASETIRVMVKENVDQIVKEISNYANMDGGFSVV